MYCEVCKQLLKEGEQDAEVKSVHSGYCKEYYEKLNEKEDLNEVEFLVDWLYFCIVYTHLKPTKIFNYDWEYWNRIWQFSSFLLE